MQKVSELVHLSRMNLEESRSAPAGEVLPRGLLASRFTSSHPGIERQYRQIGQHLEQGRFDSTKVYDTDPGYVKWCLEQQSRYPQMNTWRTYAYLRNRFRGYILAEDFLSHTVEIW